MEHVNDDASREHARRIVHLLAQLFAPRWRGAVWIVVFGVASAAVTMATASVSRAVVDRYAASGVLWALVLGWAALLVLAGALAWISSWITFQVGRSIVAPLADAIFERLAGHTLAEFERGDPAETQTFVNQTLGEGGNTISNGLSWLVTWITQMIGALVGIALMSWRTALVTTPVIVLVGLSMVAMGRFQSTRAEQEIELEAARTELVADLSKRDRFRAVHRNGLGGRIVARFRTVSAERERAVAHRRRIYTIYSQLLGTASALAAPIVWAAVSTTGMSVGTVVALVTLLSQVVFPLSGIADWYIRWAEHAPYLRRGIEFVEQPREAQPDVDRSIRAADLAGRPLVLEDLHCRRGERDVLRGVDLVVAPGSHVALVGLNGAGKSTLFDVITGLVPPRAEASVRIGETPIARIPRAVLASFVRAVDSTPATFGGSVDENIRMLAPEAPDAEVAWARGVAQIGFSCEREMSQCSTGEKIQALVAQAVLARPRVLLLDEGLKHLHPGTRRALRTALRRELPDTTVFEVSHEGAVRSRLVTRIVVLDDGVIAESGSHEELMALGGRYAAAVADSLE